MSNLTASQKKRLLRQLDTLEADYVVVDLGSGSNYNTVDFFIASAGGIVVTTPHLTSILNAYLFLKNCVFRLLMRSFDRSSPATEKIRELHKNPQAMQRLYVPALVQELRALDAEGVERFDEQVHRFSPSIILNLLDDPRDAGKAGKIRRSCKQYLGIDVEHLGVIYRDALQDTALASSLPIIIYKPESVLSRAIVRIADKLLEAEWSEDLDVEFDGVDDGYQTAESEAEVDFTSKIESMQDLLDGGVLSQGDLIETIRSQQYEIGRLRRENTFLKTKLVDASEAGFDV
jgi:flagellar biosynthesis protein FlhG